MSAVCRTLKDVVSINQKFLYSDSEVALTWIKGKIKQWKPWVQNTVNKIKKITNEADWFYVKTSSNPADVGTHVNSVIKLPRNELWWYGPSFLRGNDVLDQVKSNVTVDGDINESLTLTNETFPKNRHGIGEVIKFDKYSCLMKLLRIAAYIFRFMNCCLKSCRSKKGEISDEEIDEVLEKIIKRDQLKVIDDNKFGNMKR